MQAVIRVLDSQTGREAFRPVQVVDSSMPTNITMGRPTASRTVRLNGHDVSIEEIDRAYHAAHGGRSRTASGTVTLSDGRGGTYVLPAATAASYRQQQGSARDAASFSEDDDDTASSDDLPREAVGAIVRFNDEVQRTAKDQGVDIRAAAQIVQLRDGGHLYWLSRCEAAGHRVPRAGSRRNRHFIRDDE